MDEASLPAKLPVEDNPPGYRGRELGSRLQLTNNNAWTSQNIPTQHKTTTR